MANANKKAKAPASSWQMKLLAVVLALLVLFGLAWTAIESTGIIQRSTVSIKSEHYKVNNAMLSYLFQTEYSKYVSNYGSYLQYLGLDTSKPLKSQYYDQTSKLTWYEYFLKQALTSAKNLLVLCEEAYARDLELEDEDWEDVDAAIDALKESAKSYSMSTNEYVSYMYGKGVKLSDIKDCMEMSALASKVYNTLIDSYEWNDADYDKWAEENKGKIWFVDYMSYDFKADIKSGDDEDAKKAAREKAENLAKDLASMTKEDDFFNWLLAYQKTGKAPEQTTDASATEAATDEVTGAETAAPETDAQIEAQDEDATEAESSASTAASTDASSSASTAASTETAAATEELTKDKITTKEFGYDDKTDFGKWAFASDRAELDTTVIYNKDSESYTAYLILKPIYRHEYNAVDVRHILVSLSSTATQEQKDEAKKKADDILAEYLAGEKTAEAFGKLAKEYSDDGSSSDGGLFEGVLKDQMTKEFNDWIYDETRKAGDTGIVTTTYGLHVMYFEGFNNTAWKVTADNGLDSDQYEADYEEMEAKYVVDINYDNAYKVNG